jgi:hypothetical protein
VFQPPHPISVPGMCRRDRDTSGPVTMITSAAMTGLKSVYARGDERPNDRRAVAAGSHSAGPIYLTA